MSNSKANSEAEAACRSLLRALRERYLDDTNDVDQFQLQQKHHKDGQIIVQLVGRQHMQQIFSSLHRLPQICLEDMQISSAYNESSQSCDQTADLKTQFQEMMQQLKILRLLNLSRNLLHSWAEIALIINNCPSLRQLVLSDNPLHKPLETELCADDLVGFERIELLVLAGLHLDWTDVLQLGRWFTGIKSLNLHTNCILVLQPSCDNLFAHLESIDLSNNPLADWQQLLQLGQLQCLSSLSVNNCGLKCIQFPAQSFEQKVAFARLQYLNLNDNLIQDWESLVQLYRMPALQHLDCRHNPLFENLEHDFRFSNVVGRLPQLKLLDREEITNSKRKDAEIYYMRSYYVDWVNAVNQQDTKFQAQHPRLKDLLEVYGEPKELLQKADDRMKLLHLTFYMLDDKTGIETRFTEKIACNTTIVWLRIKAAKLFDLDDPSDLSLIWQSNQNRQIFCALEPENRKLSSFPVEEKDLIWVKMPSC